jgi:2-methylcitrate dehydratase PrpD
MNEITRTITPDPTVAKRGDAGSGFTAHVVAEVSRVSFPSLKETVIERTRHAILDWLGVSIAGASEPSARAARAVLRAEGGREVARVLGTSERMTARQAALAGGIAGHALDFDDMGPGGHPSVVVLPAVFAVAEEIGADGRATLEAILQGYETLDLVGNGCGYMTSYARGYHCTGTFGAFGATIGVGRLLNLDALGLQRAMGIAGTQASGLKASFGTMSKHLNAGNAAAVGVLAARLAEAGFTGATNVLESPQGFAVAHNDSPADFNPSGPGTSLGERLAVERIMFKPHAACAGTHSTINGIQAIMAQRRFSIEEIDEVELVVSEQLLPVCGIAEPTTGVEGMFSVRHAATLALTGGMTGPGGFTDERVRDPYLIAIRKLVKVTPVARLPHTGSPAEVSIRLKSGERLTACVDPLVVTADDGLDEQWKALEAKFQDLVAPVLGADRSRDLVRMVQRFEGLGSIRELADMAAPA